MKQALKILHSSFIWVFKAPIYAYKYAISPLLGQNCRFYPSCSTYTLQALEQHGVLKGLYLGVRRMSKCHPYCKTQFHDPVPDQFRWPIFSKSRID